MSALAERLELFLSLLKTKVWCSSFVHAQGTSWTYGYTWAKSVTILGAEREVKHKSAAGFEKERERVKEAFRLNQED